jgi:DNA polymerase III subunit epsilon
MNETNEVKTLREALDVYESAIQNISSIAYVFEGADPAYTVVFREILSVCTAASEGAERALAENNPSPAQLEHARNTLSIASQFLPEEFVVFDIETTGLDPKTDAIIEIGAVLVRRSQVIIGDKTFQSLQTLIRIDSQIPAHISSLTGISDNMLRENGVQLPEALEEFRGFVGNRRLVAYNAKFDVAFMNEAMGRYGFTLPNPVSCALNMARCAWPERQSFKLKELARAIDVDQEQRAVSDTVRALIVYLAAVRELHAHE